MTDSPADLLPGLRVLDAETVRASGTSAEAVAAHYDLPIDFFRSWLGPDLVYSCALWDADPVADLAAAQRAKIDHFATLLEVRGLRVLDVGCGWGALAERFVGSHGAAEVVGLTLSRQQHAYARARAVPGVEIRRENWVDHEPTGRYDVVTCIEATEHLASDRLAPDDKVAVYAAFFEQLASWLQPEGKVGLQLICLDDVSHRGSRAGRGPMSELIRTGIFPEAMSGALSELVLAWEPRFRLERFAVHRDQYARTFRAWNLNLRRQREAAAGCVDAATLRLIQRYLAAGEALFRLGEQTLYRLVLRRRPAAKAWRSPLLPSLVRSRTEEVEPASPPASPQAVQAHYDLSNRFFALWLDPTMMYSSGLWEGAGSGRPAVVTDAAKACGVDLSSAVQRKIDFFLDAVQPPQGGRLLDVGCGWGGTLARALARDPTLRTVGLTLSPAQHEVCVRVAPGADVRLEAWQQHTPPGRYDAIVSFGAFEHFARDGSRAVERVLSYRRFFAACHGWLAPGGRIGLETIAHDDAPDTVAPRGRGPLGDVVLDLFPESLCPHLAEIVLGFEPWFRLEVLRSDGHDFARTFRHWLTSLRDRQADADDIVGQRTTRRFQQYLASSHLQFRTGALTNYRLVLRRRDVPHDT